MTVLRSHHSVTRCKVNILQIHSCWGSLRRTKANLSFTECCRPYCETVCRAQLEIKEEGANASEVSDWGTRKWNWFYMVRGNHLHLLENVRRSKMAGGDSLLRYLWLGGEAQWSSGWMLGLDVCLVSRQCGREAPRGECKGGMTFQSSWKGGRGEVRGDI